MKSKKKISKKSYKRKRTYKRKRKSNKKGNITKKKIQKGGIKCLTVDTVVGSPKPPTPPKSPDLELRHKINDATTLMICVNRLNDSYKKFRTSYNIEAPNKGWKTIPDDNSKILTIDSISDTRGDKKAKRESVDIDGIFPKDLNKYLIGPIKHKKFDIICFWNCGIVIDAMSKEEYGTPILNTFRNTIIGLLNDKGYIIQGPGNNERTNLVAKHFMELFKDNFETKGFIQTSKDDEVKGLHIYQKK